MIVTSAFTEGAPQADGRRYVTEHHVDDEGKSYDFNWLGDEDASLVLEARASTLNAQLAAQRAAAALVAGTLLPLTKLQFRNLFTQAEKEAIDGFHLQFESIPTLTDAQKAAIRTGLEDYKMAQDIARPFFPSVLSMLGLYAAVGLITIERMAEVVAAGNG